MILKIYFKRILLIASTVLLSALLASHYHRNEVRLTLPSKTILVFREQRSDCHFPHLNPWDPSITWHTLPIWSRSKLQCASTPPLVRYDNVTRRLSINPDHRLDDLSCLQQCVRMSANDTEEYGEWTGFPSEVECEFTRVRCEAGNRGIFWLSSTRVVVFDGILPKLVEAPARLETRRVDDRGENFNVFMILIDSVSRSNFVRQMPKTFDYVRSYMKAADFLGFTKVGPNSFPNAIAFLTGWSVQQLEYHFNTSEPADNWPLIWRNFSSRGYRTALADDMPHYGLFQYGGLGGFRRQPTDHYLRPYWLAVEHNETHIDFCHVGRPKHKLHLDYCSNFINAYPSTPKFGICWLSLFSHDQISTASLADEDFLTFFRENADVLQRSFVFFMSDHGNVMDPIAATPIGRLEANMPFLFVAVPEGLRDSPSAKVLFLNANERLVSMFDVHATFVHILSGLTTTPPTGRFGRSLLTEIPKNRTCTDAGIPSVHCNCEDYSAQEETPFWQLEEAAQQIVLEVNSLLNATMVCARLRLSAIDDVRSLGGEKRMLSIRTVPGKALFEAVVRLGSNEVEGEILRLDRYGEQSKCVANDRKLRQYCYCV